jgi:HK97 family phage major capsid protein
MNLAERIKAAEAELLGLKDQLVAVTKSLEDTPDDESLLVQVETLSGDVEKKAATVDALKKAENALASRANPASASVVQSKNMGSKASADLLFKAALAAAESHTNRTSVQSVLEKRFAGDESVALVTKAVTAPALTSVEGWAAELVRDTYSAFMDLLRPESVVPRLGLNSYTFDGYQSIKIPGRASGARLDGAFRAEGAPIPVKQMAFESKILTPKSLGVISAFSNELFERSTPNIMDVIRNAMIQDTAEALDIAFLSANAGVPGISPAGIQVGLAAGDTAVSTGTDVGSITADLRGRLQAMTSQNLGRRPVWVMHPARAWGLQLSTNAVGGIAFPEMQNGQLIGIPVVTSTNVPADIVYLIDASEVAFAGGTPRFMGTEVATLHYEDTTPLDINGSVAASPVKSLFQTNTSALRALWNVDWATGRAGGVQTITDVAW